MFGKFALVLSFSLLIFIPTKIWAQQTARGTVLLEGALVYNQPDFDASVIAELKKGSVYTVTKQKFGPFHKIQIKPGTIGFISDVDVKVEGVAGVSRPAQAKAASKISQKTDLKESQKKRKPFLYKRYRGPAVEIMSYTENTIGASRTAQMPFYGAKWSGYNTMFDGEVYTDASILASFSVPNYYKDLTGNAASGWIINMNFMFLTPSMQGPSHMAYLGFGPLLKYSHINAQLTNSASGRTLDYALDDMVVGMVLGAGLAFEIDRYALRADVKYYFESRNYASFGLTYQFDF